MVIDIYSAIRAAVRRIEEEGATDFRPVDVQGRLSEPLSIRDIKQALNDIWHQEGGIYPLAVASELWAFGYKPAPVLRRNPIGRRR